ncbi:MAG: omptin family outer membrane protease [candidate division Zixibacteria bacterium]
MLHRFIITLLAIILTIPISALGQEEEQVVSEWGERHIDFSIIPFAGYTSGHTSYRMDYPLPDDIPAVPGDTVFIASELNFPLNSFSAGLGIRLSSMLGDREDWALKLSLQKTVTQPSGDMIDDDWITVLNGYDGQFSHTESDANGSILQVDFGLNKFFIHGEKIWVGLQGGIRYQKIKQDIDNFTGWWFDADNDTTYLQSYSGAQALTYEVTYTMPYAGLIATYFASRNLSLTGSAAFARVTAKDEDDHLLRFKLSTAEGSGDGLIAGLSLEHVIKGTPNGNSVYWGIDGNLFTAKISTDQIQTWYEGATELPVGTAIPAPHDITSTQYHINLRVGIRL